MESLSWTFIMASLSWGTTERTQADRGRILPALNVSTYKGEDL